MPLATPIDVVLAVVAVLERLEVRYAVGGSFASSLHGVFRASVNVDIVAELADQHVSPLVREFSEAFYLDETAIRRAVDSRRSFNLIHLATMFKVDVFLPKGRAFDDAELSRCSPQVIATNPKRTVVVASAEDTILAKLSWYRAGGEVSEQQWRDVQGVLQVQAGRLDTEYMVRMAGSLGVDDLLDRAFAEAAD